MSWASERLAWLNNKYSYSQIREYTGIPESTISYVIKGDRVLPGKYSYNLASFFNREAYGALRSAGATRVVAQMYRGRSVASIDAYINSSNRLITSLAQSRFDQWKRYLLNQGGFISDEDTMARLVDSITKQMSKPPRVSRKGQAELYPTLRHQVVVDEE